LSIVVQKFGGSSLADLEKLRRVADIVTRTRVAGQDLVVVVSAMGKASDGLLALGRDAARLPGAPAGTPAEPPRRELDMLVSTGERVSMALLSIAIRARGSDAVSLTGSQSGIITNDRHFDARILEVRPFRVEDELARGRIVIVAGYQGMSYRREITTLGRGARALRSMRAEPPTSPRAKAGSRRASSITRRRPALSPSWGTSASRGSAPVKMPSRCWRRRRTRSCPCATR
jgi:aspartate kinase